MAGLKSLLCARVPAALPSSPLLEAAQADAPEEDKVLRLAQLLRDGVSSTAAAAAALREAARRGECRAFAALLAGGARVGDGEELLRLVESETRNNKRETAAAVQDQWRKEVKCMLEEFVEAFVFVYEKVLSEYTERLQEHRTKGGKWAEFMRGILKTGGQPEVLGKSESILVAIGVIEACISKLGETYNRKQVKRLIELLTIFTKEPHKVREYLVHSALSVFENFERQFVQVTADGVWERAIAKLSEDAVYRSLNYFKETDDVPSVPSITKGVVSGKSRTYVYSNTFLPYKPSGHTLQDKNSKKWNTASCFGKAGLVVKAGGGAPPKYYRAKEKERDGSAKYGHRLLFQWESGSARDLEQEGYEEATDFKEYSYVLELDEKERKRICEELLEKINKNDEKYMEKRLQNLYKEGADRITKSVDETFSFLQKDLEDNASTLKNIDVNVQILLEEVRKVIQLKTDETNKSKWFNLHPSLSSFVGREEKLDQIEVSLRSEKIVVINGLGGVGKTELASRHVREKYSKDSDSVLWINAENEKSFKESFRKLAADLQIPTTYLANGNQPKEREIRDIIKDVCDYFSDKKSVFILDNAEHYDDLHIFFQVSARTEKEQSHILITSRNRDWEFERKEVEIVELKEFSSHEAKQFVEGYLNIPDNDSDIEQLGEKLQYFPLALKQAVSYINSKNPKSRGPEKYKISDYLREYENKKSKLLSYRSTAIDSPYYETVLTTWKISIDKIKTDPENGENASGILNIMAYFVPDRIEVKVFSKYLTDSEQLTEAIELLSQNSMISAYEGILNVHRLVQEVTRLALKEERQEQAVLRSVFTLLENDINSCNVNHAVSVWNHIIFDVEKETGESQCKLLVETFNKLPSQVLNELGDSIRYEEANSFGQKVLHLLKERLRLNDEYILYTEHGMGVLLHKQGLYKDAESKFRCLLKRREELYASDHEEVLSTKEAIADACYKQGRYDEALSIYREIQRAMEASGTCGGRYLSITRKEAMVLNNKGQYTEALEKCEAVLDQKGNTLDADVLSAMHEKARALDNLGRYIEAITAFKETLHGQQLLLKPDDYSILYTLHALGRALSNQGEYAESLVTYRKVLEARRRYGADDPDALATANNICVVLNKQGRFQEAMAEYEQVLAKRVGRLGPDHPSTLYTQHGRAKVLHNQGRYEEALTSFHDTFEKRRRRLGENQPATLSTMHEIAAVLSSMGKYQEAEEQFRNVLERRNTHLGATHPSTLSTKHGLAEVLAKMGRYNEAKEMYEEVYEERMKLLRNKHPCTLATKCGMAHVLGQLGEHAKAMELYEETYEVQLDTLGAEHPSTLATRFGMAQLLCETGKRAEAMDAYAETHRLQRDALGADHPAAARTRSAMQELKKAMSRKGAEKSA